MEKKADKTPLPRPAGEAWPISDLAAYLACSERHVARLIAANKVRSIRCGRRVLVPDEEVRRICRDGC